jgi:phenylpropionate dioxygenase-like ring-hydroxylating dioxygenase large terminal subunit
MQILIFILNIFFVNSFFNNKIFLNKKYILKTHNLDNVEDTKYYRFGMFPRLDTPNEHGELTWYPIGLPHEFSSIYPKRVTIRDSTYIVWKDKNEYYALKDACSHQGSSFQGGCVNKNTIMCPYHGYQFDGMNGKLVDIPQLEIKKCYNQINSFNIAERNGIVFINTASNNIVENTIDNNLIWNEPEAFDPNQNAITLTEIFEHNAKFVTVNSLDICHIGFVHTFGNKKNPNPVTNTQIQKIPDSNFHYKISYEYLAGANSIVSKLYNFTKIRVENEYILPHTTIARVLFGNYSSTIVTIAQPISTFKTRLYVKAYRNYWYIDKKKANIFELLINNIGDYFTYDTMYKTLKQDKFIVDNIDKTNYRTMHGNFSIKYDMMSNHYKHNYKKYFELDKYSF